MTKRLRIAHVVVQPVLVYDDGEELSPGPATQPFQIPVSGLTGLPELLAGQLAQMNEQNSDEPLARTAQPSPVDENALLCSHDDDDEHPEGEPA